MTNLVRPSRDGDQFHYLWAARRCLALLPPTTDLAGISIDGVSPEEASHESSAPAGDSVIDIAEYYGDIDPSRARRIRYMQLKHSTRRAAQPWTASRLKTTLKGFASRYSDLVSRFGPDYLSRRVEFRFVTNRPVSAKVMRAVDDAARDTVPRHPTELGKLERYTGLAGVALSSFCSLVRFEYGQDDYWVQRNILHQEVSGYLPGSDVDAPVLLKELVTRKASSEGAQNPLIQKVDVLRALRTDESSLYPAPCRIAIPDKVVPREQEAELTRAILDAKGRPVIVHALAGVGKSVFATRIRSGLPEGSVCIIYDCFAHGGYRSATDSRHRHRDALVQIANELAAKALCHPLIPTAHAEATAYVRAFISCVRQAVSVIRQTDRAGLLCIVIDAADNAQQAAEENGQHRSFALDLLRETLPEGARLIVLCRTHRQELLDPPPQVLRLELKTFTLAETAAHLRQTFPDAIDPDVEEFHRLSSQNPRVQAWVLSRKLPLPETLRELGPNPTTVEDTIEHLLNNAVARLRDNAGVIERQEIDKVFKGLAVLRPRVPIAVLAAISGVAQEAVRSFALDMGGPLLVKDDAIQFRDEPVETWFQSRYKPPPDKLGDFVRGLIPLATGSPYVAAALPQLMLEAGQLRELVGLALTSSALPQTSEMETRAVEHSRAQFALKAALRSGNYLDATKLTLKAGEQTAGDGRRRKLIQANTDLAALFFEPDLIQEIVSRRSFASGWRGSHLVYEAGLLSGCPAFIGDARSRLRMAHEWLNNWSRLSDDQRREETVSDIDIAELAMAELNVHGHGAAARAIGGWRPRSVSFRVGRIVVRRLVDHDRITDANRLIEAAGDDYCLVLAGIIELHEVHRMPPVKVVDWTFRRLQRLSAKARKVESDGSDETTGTVTAVAEAAFKLRLCSRDDAAELLSRHLPPTPPRGLVSRFPGPHSALLRAYSLRAVLKRETLELADLAHPDLRTDLDRRSPHSATQEARDFKRDVGVLLPWYLLWAAVSCGDVSKDDFAAQLAKARAGSEPGADYFHPDTRHVAGEVALVWFDVLHLMDAVNAESVDNFTAWIGSLKRPLFTPTLHALARLGARQEETRPFALEVAAQAFRLARDERTDAEAKSGDFVDVARAVLSINKTEAKAYFDAAVTVSSKVGDENVPRWDAMLNLADQAAHRNRPVPNIAYKFARCAELTYDYVARDKHFDWQSTVQAISFLCPSSSFAILSRWRDRRFGWTSKVLPAVTEVLIKSGSLDPRDALPLIGFDARWNHAELLDAALGKCANQADKIAVERLLFRYAKYSAAGASTWKEMQEAAARHGLSGSHIEEHVASAERQDRAASRQSSEDAARSPKPRDVAKLQWDEVFSERDLTTVDGIASSYSAFRQTPPPLKHDEFFAEAIRRVHPGAESAFLSAAGDVPAFSLYCFSDLLAQVPDGWRQRPVVQQALEGAVKTLCRRYCMKVARHRHWEIPPFNDAFKRTGVNQADIIDLVLDGIGKSPDPADSDRLFSLVGLLTSKLTGDQALDALAFGLELFDAVLESSDGDGPWSGDLAPPPTVEESLAGYVYTGLADPSAAVRWEAAHAVVGICALERTDVLRHLINLADTASGGPFADARLPFYRLHAFQWLLTACARAATEHPASLTLFASRFVDWALHDVPHVMIRQFAARTALALLQHGVLPTDRQLERRLSRVNVSPHPIVESNSLQRVAGHELATGAGNDKDRFYFYMDAGPYWYKPLGQVFALPQRRIEAEALAVIRNELHRQTDERTWRHDERRRRHLYARDRHGSDRTYATHGSYPGTDDYQFYLAYHAMMIVAGRLLATTPTHHDRGWSDQDEFAEWLSRHDLTRRDGRWLADRRDPNPPERPAWLGRKEGEPDRGAVTTADFEEALIAPGWLNVWGRWSTTDSTTVRTVSVASALACRNKSHALLRALSGLDDTNLYEIPSAGEEHQIDRAGFVLKGWISTGKYPSGLDDKDKWSGNVDYPPPRPASAVVELMHLEADADTRKWRDPDKRYVMSSEAWGRLAGRDEDDNPEHGERLSASTDFITDLLGRLGLDLILGVHIEVSRRYRRYEPRDRDDEQRKTGIRHYRLGPDGGITSV